MTARRPFALWTGFCMQFREPDIMRKHAQTQQT